jgi:type I restriction enzyme S subunit
LGDVAQTKKGQIKPDEMTDDLQYVGLEHITRKSLSLTDSGTAGKLESNKFRFSKGDLLFGKLRPYFHKVCIAPFDGVCSTDILVIEPKAPEWYAFVVFHFYSNDLIAFTTSTADGTRMPRTSWGDLSGFEIAIPPKKLASDFTEIVKPIFEKIHRNNQQSRTLTALRDALLPRLMRGEVLS